MIFKPGTICVYGIVDSRNSQVHYIGMTLDLAMRAKQHITGYGCPKNAAYENWVKSLIYDGRMITEFDFLIFKLLPPIKKWISRRNRALYRQRLLESEKKWIIHGFKNGWPLTNNRSSIGSEKLV